MSLYVVATPIGNPKDITQNAVEVLTQATVVIGEERKEASKLLRSLGLTGKRLEVLNEHSRAEDLALLIDLCRTETVALISDCGTPAFCDPGADLVRTCRTQGIAVHSAPGASSLMAFLSVAGVQLRQFHFRGFLPARGEERVQALKALRQLPRPFILMDTPYRLERTVQDLVDHLPTSRCILGMDLTQETEKVLSGDPAALLSAVRGRKAEFMLMVL